MEETWTRGNVVVRSEMLGLQPDEVVTATGATGVWLRVPALVVDDTPSSS